LDLATNAAAFNVTMTPSQHAGFTGVTVTGNDTITLSVAGSVTGLNTATATDDVIYALAGTTAASTFTASTTAQDYNVSGGRNNTYNFGSTLTAADTITGSAGTTDTLNLTGAATGSNNVTAIDTINVNYATAATFTTGAITPGVASTITAAGSTAAATINATAYVPTTSLTITDGPGADVITVPALEASTGLTTVNLTGGGADRVVHADAETTVDATGFIVNGFTTGVGAGADIFQISLTTAAPETHTFVGDYAVVSAAGGAVTIVNSTTALQIIEVNIAAGAATSLTDTSAGGAVEIALASAIGAVTMAGGVATRSVLVILYGTGAASGNAGLYNVVFTDGADATAANMTVDLIAVVNGVAADSFVSSNFGG
jgi:hypothetical protein